MSARLIYPAIDRELALARVGGDAELLKEIARLFLDDYPKVLEELRVALASSDARSVERSAHGLKGSVSHFGALAAVEAARTIEELGRTRQLAGVDRVIEELDLALVALRPELEAL